MKFIQGVHRQQVEIVSRSLDETVDADNEVRIIDLFVDTLPFAELGFPMDYDENGRPAYHPGDLLKLFLYGYLHRIRSSRQLEAECRRNLEVIWLMKGLVPDHNTIANFRKDNPEAIRKVFRASVNLAKHFELIGGKLLAGDSTKLRAQNSKKNNFNIRKINVHLEYIEQKLSQYNSALASADGDDRVKISAQIQQQEERMQKYHRLQEQLQQTGEVQVSFSSPPYSLRRILNIVDPEKLKSFVKGGIAHVYGHFRLILGLFSAPGMFFFMLITTFLKKTMPSIALKRGRIF